MILFRLFSTNFAIGKVNEMSHEEQRGHTGFDTSTKPWHVSRASKGIQLTVALLAACALLFSAGCEFALNASSSDRAASNGEDSSGDSASQDATGEASQLDGSSGSNEASESGEANDPSAQREARLADLSQKLGIVEDYRPEFDHGPKDAQYQKYIVLHDTEVDASPGGIADSWDSSNNGIAAHFVIGKDGSVVQCVPLDRIAHHAGFGDAGHNHEFGVEDESRDDRVGTESIGKRYPDYGMNSYSVGIELVHVGSSGEGYPEAQLRTLDNLIAYIDTYFGNESQIIDHKAWRTTNSDTSPEFAGYLASYQAKRTHV